MYTPEVESKIAIWRAKAAEGTLTIEEMREAIIELRQGRVSAAYASEGARTKKAAASKPAASIDPNDLLSELEGL